MSEKYDYEAAVKSDIRDYLKEHDVEGRIDEDLRQKLEDDMFVCDSVTGNASGSYTFNTWRAEENLSHNWDLIGECAEHFGIEDTSLSKGAEYWDSSIRCYLLNRCLTEVVDEWNAEYDADSENDDEEGED
jgi:hypothetical protein